MILKKTKKKIDSIEILRLLAFLGVFIEHMHIRNLGTWGVSVFLVISGFLMTYSYWDVDLTLGFRNQFFFSAHKISKLYPLHIVTMISAIIAQCVWGKIFYSPIRSVIDCGIVALHVIMCQAWIPRPGVFFSLNGVSWYLCVCFFCYFMFPMILRHIKKANKKEILYGGIFVYSIQIVIAYGSVFVMLPKSITRDFTYWITYVCPLFRLGDFILGCFLSFFYIDQLNCKERDNKSGTLIWTFIEMLALIISLLILPKKMELDKWRWISTGIVYLPLSMVLVYSFAMNKGWVSQALTRKPLVYCGGLTPFAFLIHFQVINDVRKYIYLNPSILFSICLFISFVLSWVWKTLIFKLLKKT